MRLTDKRVCSTPMKSGPSISPAFSIRFMSTIRRSLPRPKPKTLWPGIKLWYWIFDFNGSPTLTSETRPSIILTRGALRDWIDQSLIPTPRQWEYVVLPRDMTRFPEFLVSYLYSFCYFTYSHLYLYGRYSSTLPSDHKCNASSGSPVTSTEPEDHDTWFVMYFPQKITNLNMWKWEVSL